MTVATVASRALAGIDAPEVTVEVHLGPGLPAFHIVGLPDTEVREARDRVRAALNHVRFEFPARRITVNLAPAELPKDSTRFDLPIALASWRRAGSSHRIRSRARNSRRALADRRAASDPRCARHGALRAQRWPGVHPARGKRPAGGARRRRAHPARPHAARSGRASRRRDAACRIPKTGTGSRAGLSRFQRCQRTAAGETRARSGGGGRP